MTLLDEAIARYKANPALEAARIEAASAGRMAAVNIATLTAYPHARRDVGLHIANAIRYARAAWSAAVRAEEAAR